MEANEQTLYNDELLNILPDGVIILDINGEVIQLNQQALTELHVHSSANAMMPLPTNRIFKLLNKKEDILSTILDEIRQGKKTYSLPEHTFMQEQVDYTQFPIRGEFATMENEEGKKNILFFFRNITVELTQEYILNTALQSTRIYPWYYDISRSEFTLDDRYFEHLGIPAGENIRFLLNGNQMNVRVRNFQSDNSFAYLLARESLFNGAGYFLGKYMHSAQIFIAQIKNIVCFLFGHHQCMPLYQRVDIEKSKKLFVFRYLVAGDFTCDDSAEYCCHNFY